MKTATQWRPPVADFQQTRRAPATETMLSMYGNTTYAVWCAKEAARINSRPGRVARVERKGDKVSLWLNDVADGSWAKNGGVT